MDITTLTEFFGWMTLINIAIYTVTAFVVIALRDPVMRLQSRLTGLPETAWPQAYVDYMSRFKVAIFVGNIAPYLALVLMG